MSYKFLLRDANGSLVYKNAQEAGALPFNQFFTGNAYFVKPYSGLDTNSGEDPAAPLKTLAAALAKASTDHNDVVYMIAESNTAANTSDYQATALDWNKDGVHLIGVNAAPRIGQRSRIAQLSSVKDIQDLFTVSADNCLIANLEIFQGVAAATAVKERAMVVSGERNHIVNCQISGNGDTGGSMDDAASRSLVISGSENFFENCYIGLDTVIRATQTAEVEVAAAAARNVLKNCHINSYTSLSTFKAIAATSLERFLLLEECMLSTIQNITSAVTPTGAISNTTPNGMIMMKGGGVFGYTQITTADDSKTLVLTHNGLATGHLVGIAQGVDAA